MIWISFFAGIGVAGFVFAIVLVLVAGKMASSNQRQEYTEAKKTLASHERLLSYWDEATALHKREAEALERIADKGDNTW